MRRRDFIKVVAGSAAVWPLAAYAQQSDPVRRIGVLMPFVEGDPEGEPRVIALQRGLEELGWTIGRNIRIDYRWGIADVEKTASCHSGIAGADARRDFGQYQPRGGYPA
jgi:putative ABC transport system substrate-binding protein